MQLADQIDHAAGGRLGAAGAGRAGRDDDRLGLVGEQLLDDPMILAGLINNMPLIECLAREKIEP
jgi:hypothetical protein